MKLKTYIKLFLLTSLILVLSACSQNKSKTAKTQVNAQTLIATASNTKINNLNTTWQQMNGQKTAMQSANLKYQTKNQIAYGNFATNSNHYQIWVKGNTSYMQMNGTATKKWFKTSSQKNLNFAKLTTLLPAEIFSIFNAKSFKVTTNNAGYLLTYQGKNNKIWKQILNGNLLPSDIGLDPKEVKPGQIKLTVNLSKKANLKNLTLIANYQANNKTNSLYLKLDQINQLPILSIPKSITKSAVDLADSGN